jgi:CRISPR/Cas system-associated exonuclease Cas4 (RecB family)
LGNKKLLGAWSPSKQERFEKCRLQALKTYGPNKKRIAMRDPLKIPREECNPLERGILIHQFAEDFLMRGAHLDVVLSAHYRDQFMWLRECFQRGVAYSEHTIKFKIDGEHWVELPASSRAYDVITILDALVVDGDTAYVIDYKTGGYDGKLHAHSSQGKAYAMAVLHAEAFKHVTRVHVQFWYVEHPKSRMYARTYDRSLATFDTLTLTQKIHHWLEVAADECSPTSNTYNCTYCDFAEECGR